MFPNHFSNSLSGYPIKSAYHSRCYQTFSFYFLPLRVLLITLLSQIYIDHLISKYLLIDQVFHFVCFNLSPFLFLRCTLILLKQQLYKFEQLYKLCVSCCAVLTHLFSIQSAIILAFVTLSLYTFSRFSTPFQRYEEIM